MKALEKIHKYLRETLKLSEEDINAFDSSSVYLAQEIALYAHRNQYRENGDNYLNHSFNCLDMYRRMVGIVPDDYFCINRDCMAEHRIPFEGVQEVCILHDVLNDINVTDITMEEIAEIYAEFDLQSYFELYIRNPLELITRDNSVPYSEYILSILDNPISSIVKMIDLFDNLNLFNFCNLDDKKISRSKYYLDCIKIINDKYHFIENAILYKADYYRQNQK